MSSPINCKTCGIMIGDLDDPFYRSGASFMIQEYCELHDIKYQAKALQKNMKTVQKELLAGKAAHTVEVRNSLVPDNKKGLPNVKIRTHSSLPSPDGVCNETVYGYASDGDILPACALPKGHIGKHNSWYSPKVAPDDKTYPKSGLTRKEIHEAVRHIRDNHITKSDDKDSGWVMDDHGRAHWVERNASSFMPLPDDKDVVRVEQLSSKLHNIYQQEARRREDVRHADKYEDLSESTKEWDRVLARYILQEQDNLLGLIRRLEKSNEEMGLEIRRLQNESKPPKGWD